MEVEKDLEKHNVHMGHNVMKFRQLKGYKQAAFAQMIGLKSQQDVSRLESKPVIDTNILETIAPVLGVSAEVLQTLKEESDSFVIENNTIDIETGGIGYFGSKGIESTINNPVDQIIDLIREKDRKEQERIEAMEKRIIELEELIRKGK